MATTQTPQTCHHCPLQGRACVHPDAAAASRVCHGPWRCAAARSTQRPSVARAPVCVPLPVCVRSLLPPGVCASAPTQQKHFISARLFATCVPPLFVRASVARRACCSAVVWCGGGRVVCPLRLSCVHTSSAGQGEAFLKAAEHSFRFWCARFFSRGGRGFCVSVWCGRVFFPLGPHALLSPPLVARRHGGGCGPGWLLFACVVSACSTSLCERADHVSASHRGGAAADCLTRVCTMMKEGTSKGSNACGVCFPAVFPTRWL